VGYLAFSFANVLWGVIRGAGDAISPLWASIINSIIVRLPSAYLLVYLLGRPHALMYSLVISWSFGLLYAITVFRIGKWRTKGLVKKI
jgi:Na+-driven multidrug efflux pump